MRKFKFRAWIDCKEPIKNFMVYSEKSLGDFFDHTLYGLKYTLMQYTGLKDKNGKEIYEGDVVKRNNRRFPDRRNVWRVEWREGSSGWALFVPATYEHSRNKRLLEKFMIGDSNYEVIGNVYETPELLGE